MAYQVSGVRRTRGSHHPCQQHKVSATQGTNGFCIFYLWKVVTISSYETFILSSWDVNQTVHLFQCFDTDMYLSSFQWLKSSFRSLLVNWNTHIDPMQGTSPLKRFASHWKHKVDWENTFLSINCSCKHLYRLIDMIATTFTKLQIIKAFDQHSLRCGRCTWSIFLW